MRPPTRSGVVWPPVAPTPEQFAAIEQQLASQYLQAEQALLDIMGRGDITDWTRAFTTQQLAQVRAVLDNLGTNTETWARFHLPTLYEAGLAEVDGHLMSPDLGPLYRQLRGDGLGHMQVVERMAALGKAPGGLSVAAHPGLVTPMDLGFTKLHSDAVAMLSENLVVRLGEARSYCGQWLEIMAERAAGLRNDPTSKSAAWIAEKKIRSASLETLQKAFLKGQTHREASKAFLADLRARGITSFVDKSGRQWPMRQYADMVVQTVCSETQRHGVTNRMLEAGQDVVKVTDPREECTRCRPWERRLLSITGRTEGLATVNEALAAGLCHPRCRHRLVPHITGRSIATA